MCSSELFRCRRFGPPPASKEAVKALEEITLDEKSLEALQTKECAVCQELFAVGGWRLRARPLS